MTAAAAARCGTSTIMTWPLCGVGFFADIALSLRCCCCCCCQAPHKYVDDLATVWCEFFADIALFLRRICCCCCCQVPYKYVDDLATVWCEWAEMELRHNNFKSALQLMRRATEVCICSMAALRIGVHLWVLCVCLPWCQLTWCQRTCHVSAGAVSWYALNGRCVLLCTRRCAALFAGGDPPRNAVPNASSITHTIKQFLTFHVCVSCAVSGASAAAQVESGGGATAASAGATLQVGSSGEVSA
jgi:hypothetical protein